MLNSNNLSSFLKLTREKRGLSVRELALKASVSHTEIFRIEKGERTNPSITMLKALADALNVSVSDFLQACGIESEKPATEYSAAGLSDASDLSTEELAEVQKYIDFLKSKRA